MATPPKHGLTWIRRGFSAAALQLLFNAIARRSLLGLPYLISGYQLFRNRVHNAGADKAL